MKEIHGSGISDSSRPALAGEPTLAGSRARAVAPGDIDGRGRLATPTRPGSRVERSALYFLFVLLPGVLGIGLSFTDWSAYSTRLDWVGLQNFSALFQPNSFYLLAIENTLIFTVATIILKTVIGLALAILLTSGIKRLSALYRALIFIPNLLPMVAVGIVFKSILDPTTGLLNSTLRTLGLGGLAAGLARRHPPGALERDRRGHLEGRWLHHGHPDRRSACHSPRVLRGSVL